MKKVLWLMMLFAFCCEAKADKAQNLDKIIELTSGSIQVQKMSDKIMEPSLKMLKCSVENFSANDEKQIKALFAQIQNVDEEKAFVRKFYNENFNDAEIQEMLAFYDTMAGRKLLALQPMLMAEVSMISMNKVQKIRRKVQSVMEDILKNKRTKNQQELQKCMSEAMK